MGQACGGPGVTFPIGSMGKVINRVRILFSKAKDEVRLAVRKPAFCICENKDTDQLRYIDSTNP